jgi:phage terminase small subunit
MGRHKKPIEQRILEGSYRKNVHGNSVEPIIYNALEVPDIKPTTNLTDPFVINHYQHHVQLLARLNILTYSDIPEIEIMYHALQEYRKLYNELQKVDIIKDLEKYDKLSERMLRIGQRFSNLAVKYCISPIARNKLTLESLQIKKEVESQKSITAFLIEKKKA